MSKHKLNTPREKPIGGHTLEAGRLAGIHIEALDSEPEALLASAKANPRIVVIAAIPYEWDEWTKGYILITKDAPEMT